MKQETPQVTRKSQVDAILCKLPGVVSKKIGGMDAYFVNDRMFACINGNGLGLRLPVAAARDLQFSRGNVVPFQPAGMPSSSEWIQINRDDAAAVDALMHDFFVPYVRLRAKQPGYAVSIVKAGAEIVGRTAGRVRPPLSNLNLAEFNELEDLIAKLGPQD